MAVLEWPCDRFDEFRDWIEAGSRPATIHPLANRTFATCESGDVKYTVVIGFATLAEAQAAHEFIAKI